MHTDKYKHKTDRGVSRIYFRVGKNVSVTPAEFDSAPGALQTGGGAEREKGRDIS